MCEKCIKERNVVLWGERERERERERESVRGDKRRRYAFDSDTTRWPFFPLISPCMAHTTIYDRRKAGSERATVFNEQMQNAIKHKNISVEVRFVATKAIANAHLHSAHLSTYLSSEI